MVSPEFENPYASSVQDAQASILSQRQRRPNGIWVVSGINLLPGVAILTIVLLMAIQDGIAATIEHLRTLSFGALIFMSLILPIGVIAGAGLWKGYRWSWYGSILYCSQHIYGTCRAFVHYQGTLWAATVILINLSLVIYLLTGKPCQYLGIGSQRLAVAIGVFLISVAQYHLLVWMVGFLNF